MEDTSYPVSFKIKYERISRLYHFAVKRESMKAWSIYYRRW
jgi:hypothetical protein